MNLHDIKIQGDQYRDVYSQQDYSFASEDVHVYFKNIEEKLINCIASADIVVGCVAWLTSRRILQALSKKRAIAIVVQKEDFLRPDTDSDSRWKETLHNLYVSLPGGLSRYDDILREMETQLYCMSSFGNPDIDPIRCVGNHNSERVAAFPRSHHKFLLFCRGEKRHNGWQYEWEPYQVWTGSYNLTKNAGMSFENAIVLKDKQVVKAYFQEWAQIEALSEPLNWESDWCSPEWRIGS